MLLLALDTSTSAVTVALHDGSRLLAEATTIDARAHGERLAPGIRAVLAEAGATPREVTDVVAGVGPGPFTGLRVGLVTARVFAFAVGATLHGLVSLDALAAEVVSMPGEVLVATDARRKEVYWARYAGTGLAVTRVEGPAVDRPGELAPSLRALPTAGRGPVLYPDLFARPVAPHDVSAATLAALAAARLAAGNRPEAVEPMYLRRPDTAPSAPRKSALR